MLQTVEATIDEQGNVRLLEPVKLKTRQRALVTILAREAPPEQSSQLVGSLEILTDDLTAASQQISEIFNQSLEKSALELSR